MNLTPEEVKMVLDMITLTWKAGGIRAEEDAAALTRLRLKLTTPQMPPPTPMPSEPKSA